MLFSSVSLPQAFDQLFIRHILAGTKIPEKLHGSVLQSTAKKIHFVELGPSIVTSAHFKLSEERYRQIFQVS